MATESAAVSRFALHFAVGYATSGSQSIIMHQSGKFLYVASGFGVSGYTLDDTTGELTLIAPFPFDTNSRAKVLAANESGKFLYALDSLNNTVVAYTIDSATGTLGAVEGSPFALVPGTQVGQSSTDIAISH